MGIRIGGRRSFRRETKRLKIVPRPTKLPHYDSIRDVDPMTHWAGVSRMPGRHVFDAEVHSDRRPLSRKLGRMHSIGSRLLGACLAVNCVGCGTLEADVDCNSRIESALQGGSGRAALLGVSAQEMTGVIRLELSGADTVERKCSGVLLRTGAVVTAAHCLPLELDQVRLANSEDAMTVVVDRVARHPTLDIGLLFLPQDASRELEDFAPIGISDVVVAKGDLVQLAGYGSDGLTLDTTLTFAVEEVTAVTKDYIEVTGGGFSGACEGDSGGPMLVRQDNGSVAVVAVLSSGHTSCRATDRYISMNLTVDWLRAQLPSVALEDGEDVECGSISAEGMCVNDVAIYCEHEHIVSKPCGSRSSCGWDSAANGYRCTSAASDACQGIDSFGACSNGEAVTCEGGTVVVNPCEQCKDGECVRAPTSGVVTCYVP